MALASSRLCTVAAALVSRACASAPNASAALFRSTARRGPEPVCAWKFRVDPSNVGSSHARSNVLLTPINHAADVRGT